MVQTFSDVIDLFGGPPPFAREVGMTIGAAKQAKRRNSISAKWFSAIDEAARRQNLEEITVQRLAQIADGRDS